MVVLTEFYISTFLCVLLYFPHPVVSLMEPGAMSAAAAAAASVSQAYGLDYLCFFLYLSFFLYYPPVVL